MEIKNRLASSSGRRDEQLNLELAQEIIRQENTSAISELVILLKSKDSNLRNDAIKVLYETGAVKPELIAFHYDEFLELLSHKDNRLQWGAMTALAAIVEERPETIYRSLDQILQAGQTGSVITRDQMVQILVKLCRFQQYFGRSSGHLLKILKMAPTNQFPMYAEKMMLALEGDEMSELVKILSERKNDLEKESAIRRVEKILNKIGNR